MIEIEKHIINEDGTIHYYIKGKYLLHNVDDEPAVIYSNGDKCWFKYNKLHRDSGPAILYANGYKEYWLNHKRYPNIKSDGEWITKQIIE